MARKWIRLFHTVKYIKVIQVVYQLWYRGKNKFLSINWYKGELNYPINAFTLTVDRILYGSEKSVLEGRKFQFIGLVHSFDHKIDWNYAGNGKLWNYNLQYFNYLLDEDLDPSFRLELLRDFSQNLLEKKVPVEPYPVSLRIVNTLAFHSRYPITDQLVLTSMVKQINYLAHNLEFHLLGNHLLENLFSLYIVSLYLNDSRLHQKSFQLLSKELHEQILEDGGHYECSPMYQSILLGKLLLCIDVAKKSQIVEVDELNFLSQKASLMLGWVKAFSFPDGSWALMNDSAEGIAPETERLNAAAAILGIVPANLRLSTSGFRKIAGADWVVTIKTGPMQPSYQPGHAHADIASFCLWHNGMQVIVDPGISTYSVCEQRLRERGTSAHNTISINGQNQSDIWSGFRVGKRAIVQLLKDEADHLEIITIPYFDRGVKHERIFKKVDEFKLVIEDKILYNYQANLVASGGLQFNAEENVNHSENLVEFSNLRIEYSGVEKVYLNTGNYATNYNHLIKAPRLEFNVPVRSEFIFNFS